MWLEAAGVFFYSEQNSWLLELLWFLTPQHELPLATSSQPQNQICYIFQIGSWALWVVDTLSSFFSFQLKQTNSKPIRLMNINKYQIMCPTFNVILHISVYMCMHVSLQLRPKTSMDEVNDPVLYRFGFCFSFPSFLCIIHSII